MSPLRPETDRILHRIRIQHRIVSIRLRDEVGRRRKHARFLQQSVDRVMLGHGIRVYTLAPGAYFAVIETVTVALVPSPPGAKASLQVMRALRRRPFSSNRQMPVAV